MNTGINRIRLEFKGKKKQWTEKEEACINRIRLEFKGTSHTARRYPSRSINRIRLEFKVVHFDDAANSGRGINRIRLEFKACFSPLNCFCTTVLIESDWNLKLITGRQR